jgi:hypothetical protein
MWDFAAVKRRITIRHLLAALAWLGLVLAPLATPTRAMASVPMAAASVDTGAMDMSGDMPCCPQAQKAPDCAKDCPFIALCAGMAFPIANTAAVNAPATVLAALAPHDDAKLSGLAQGPPAKPPKA